MILPLLVFGPCPTVAAIPTEPWLELKATGSSLVVVTDAGEKAGRTAALQFLQFDRSLQKRFPWIKADETLPLTIFASADENTVRSMAPESPDPEREHSFSSYTRTATQHVGAMRTDVPDPSDKERSPFRGLYRGRAAYLVERSLGPAAPSWLSRGLVAFLSDSVVEEKDVRLGRMSEGGGDLAPLPSPGDFFARAEAGDSAYDLQAGLFIHYLLVANKGKNAPALDALLHKLASREPAPNIQAAIARVVSLYAGLPKHVSSRKWQPLKVSVDPSLASAITVQPITLAGALMRRAEILFEQNRPVDVRGLLRQAEAADPEMARPHEIEAILFEREQRTAEARKAMEAAIRLGSREGSLYYRLAQLEWSRTMARPQLESVLALLEMARTLSPEEPAIPSYLAEIQSDMGLTRPALDHARAGASAAPADVYAQMALARAQWNAGQTGPAQATAQKALSVARLASQKQAVQAFLAFSKKNKRLQDKGARPWTSQFGPPPAGAFGTTKSGATAARVSLGGTRSDSADASAISDCFASRDDTACARAVPALEASCAEKQTASCVSLGSLYDGGFGVRRNRRTAASFYETACGLGEKAGCARLAMLEMLGLGVPQDVERATRILESLCGEKVPDACIGLAQTLQRTGFAVDRNRAQALLKSACDAGSAEACRLRSTHQD